MKIDLPGTNSAKIAAAMIKARHAVGSPAMDMVMTLIVVTDDAGVKDALKDATVIAREHPARIVGVIKESARGKAGLDAKIRIGNNISGESILLRLRGPLVHHAESVVLPLLLPDSPVVVWWPTNAPKNPAEDALGALAQRRLTDIELTSSPRAALRAMTRDYTRGDTDLAWTRLTPWRALLAASLDQVQRAVTGGSVTAARDSASAQLLVGWLEDRLRVSVDLRVCEEPGIQAVTLDTEAGEISVRRAGRHTAEYNLPGLDSRVVPLEDRPIAGLLAEELRRLDEDNIFARTVEYLSRKDAR